ncbi:MAG: TIGR02710 family CRISPR-associated protein [Sandaracinaceae bacterium]|nr:TIGR02710 family CRISPR-associated protein [Sandaracinaceae bacterium]
MVSTLVLSVGGSPEPLLGHLSAAHWDRVVFVASDDDPVSGKPGTHAAVPALAADAGLDEARYAVVRVPADEPGAILERCLACLRAERAPGARLVVDYTGGTKSMSAMLLLAALTTQAEVEVVLGPRTDHHKVRSGTEHIVSIDTSGLESRFALDVAALAWGRFDYAAAVEALGGLRRPSPEASRALALSRGYAAWAAFDYADARERLAPLARFVPSMPSLGALASPPSKRSDAARAFDLWLASERHARATRYDLAVLLVYRANEAIAQWALRWEHGIDPGDVEPSSPVADLTTPSYDDKRVLGQHAAWEALDRLEGSLAAVARETARPRLDLSKQRNGSVLAHGHAPLSAEAHARVRDWFAQHLLPSFVQVAFPKQEPPTQLPDALPDQELRTR